MFWYKDDTAGIKIPYMFNTYSEFISAFNAYRDFVNTSANSNGTIGKCCKILRHFTPVFVHFMMVFHSLQKLEVTLVSYKNDHKKEEKYDDFE